MCVCVCVIQHYLTCISVVVRGCMAMTREGCACVCVAGCGCVCVCLCV